MIALFNKEQARARKSKIKNNMQTKQQVDKTFKFMHSTRTTATTTNKTTTD